MLTLAAALVAAAPAGAVTAETYKQGDVMPAGGTYEMSSRYDRHRDAYGTTSPLREYQRIAWHRDGGS